MFGSRFVSIVLLAATLVGFALGDQYIIKGNFVEKRADWKYGFLRGYFYYLYNSENDNACRLRLNYAIAGTTISNLYNYEDAALYSMNASKCTGLKIDERPDPWWSVGDLYTKTADEESGMFWFERDPDDVNSTTQVKRILMNEDATAPSDGYLGSIEFADGRTLTFTNVVLDNTMTADDPLFENGEECPKATCPIYADVVFVLDSSGSVNHTEWAQTVHFVNEVMNSFTFGKNAVAAAVVQFNGQDDGTFKKKIYNDPLCGTKDRYYKDLVLKRKITNPDLMASVKASADYGDGPTVSTNKEELIREMNNTIRSDCAYPTSKVDASHCQAFPGWRGTNQALGLKLAMEVLDRSPRKNYKAKPHNIIIVVTDGEDKNPNSTASNATFLQGPPYNALVIEVGVALECMYDKNYLSSIASRLYSEEKGEYPAYFDASDYGAIKVIADELFRPLCNSNYSSECGPDCKGFCAAGQCLCPECSDAEDICHVVQCTVSGGFSEGCVAKDSKYSIPDDICTSYECDPDPVDPDTGVKGEWVPVPNMCEETRNKYPGECRVVSCDLTFGGCRVSLNNSYCGQYAKSSCEEWECTPIDEVAPEGFEGCRLKKDHVSECEIALDLKEGDPKTACMMVQCSAGMSTVTKCEDMVVDKCTGKSTACYTYQCLQNATTSEYECQNTMPIPQNNYCVTWKCDEKQGWVRDVVVTATTCEEAFEDYSKVPEHDFDIRCKDYYCNPDEIDPNYGFTNGCTFTERQDCRTDCTVEDIKGCGQNHTQSDNKACYFGSCESYEDGSGNWQTRCISSDAVDCTDPNNEAAIEARELNEANPRVCFTPVCGGNGKCTVEEVKLPDTMVADNCSEPRCILGDDGSWNWEMRDTLIKQTCLTDACFIRQCVPDMGCVVDENCSKYTDECFSYSCELEEGVPVCKEEDLTKKFLDLECTVEVCENGKKVVKAKNITESCPLEHKCLQASCVEGMCKYDYLTPPGDDLCQIYTCDHATGEWNIQPKCDDHLYCTIDECWDYGDMAECHNEPVECANYLEMNGYDCFRPFCKEDNAESSFRCVRKLLPNAYVDICGNCIKDSTFGEDDSAAADSGSDALLACTHAPPKPIMVETLAAATIALIIIAAVVAGAAVTTSGVIGTKTLIAHARAAHNQSAQTNPLYEGADSEMMNPTYGNDK